MVLEADDDVLRAPAPGNRSTASGEATCAALGHPLLRTVTLPDKLHVTRVGTCGCGQRVHPRVPPDDAA